MTLKEQIDFYQESKKWYLKIINEFKFDPEKDLKARDYLNSILKKKSGDWELNHTLSSFKELLQKKTSIFIYGCGPSLEITVSTLLDSFGKSFFNKIINLAADGAAVYLLEKHIPIDATFSDLDGITKAEFEASKFMIVHAHGDNIEKLKEFSDDIITKDNIICTTQVESSGDVINTGGFTDGDRVLFFIRTLLQHDHNIYLIGMDFKDKIGKFSKLEFDTNMESSPIKRKKLDCAIKLVNWFQTLIDNPMYFINSESNSDKISSLSLKTIVENYKNYIL
ncbi:MAG: 6-hydroxymethylpterin diphosphokinase MptE-like protein [Promethearchaeota archaeon]